MDHRISATDLARKLGDVLGRVRYRGDSFVVERNGEPVARVIPMPQSGASVREAIEAWRSAGPADASFADDLEAIGAADSVVDTGWDS